MTRFAGLPRPKGGRGLQCRARRARHGGSRPSAPPQSLRPRIWRPSPANSAASLGYGAPSLTDDTALQKNAATATTAAICDNLIALVNRPARTAGRLQEPPHSRALQKLIIVRLEFDTF